MSVSVNSVIHYTQTIENLKGIISSGFRYKYCVEDVELPNGGYLCGIAMISFCDIPLSEIAQHVGSYGYYGIGLSKDWAKRKGLNPVLYIEKGSILTRSISAQMDILIEHKNETVTKMSDHFWKTMGYLKNYDGDLIRGDSKLQGYKYYNEREWRYVPDKEELNGNEFYQVDKDFFDDKERENKKIENSYLQFEASDISYLLVKKEDEILELIKHLRTVFSDKCTVSQLEVLMTKIISVENIIQDF